MAAKNIIVGPGARPGRRVEEVVEMSADKLTRESATVWLNDRRGKPVTVRLVTDERTVRESAGELRDIGGGIYRVGNAELDISSPVYTYELRYDEAEVDCLAVVFGGVEAQFRSGDRPPRVWNLNRIMDELRSEGGDA